MKDVIIISITTTTGNGMELIISQSQPELTGASTSMFAKANHQSYLKHRNGPGPPGSFFSPTPDGSLWGTYSILEVKSPTKIVKFISGITKEDRQKDLTPSAMFLPHARYQPPE
jgi:hypothetical protein